MCSSDLFPSHDTSAQEAQKKIDNCVTITKDAEKAISEYHAQAQASRKWLEAY